MINFEKHLKTIHLIIINTGGSRQGTLKSQAYQAVTHSIMFLFHKRSSSHAHLAHILTLHNV